MGWTAVQCVAEFLQRSYGRGYGRLIGSCMVSILANRLGTTTIGLLATTTTMTTTTMTLYLIRDGSGPKK